jgi:hypothetical protein
MWTGETYNNAQNPGWIRCRIPDRVVEDGDGLVLNFDGRGVSM